MQELAQADIEGRSAVDKQGMACVIEYRYRSTGPAPKQFFGLV